MSLQRLRAEKATADVLAILESHGATDVSEAYDSSSDQEATPCGSEVGHSSFKEEETLANGKLSGRSLSWKSGKDSPHSLEKKCINSSRRRRSSFVSSASSSPKHVGKSCRQIRRRETRYFFICLLSPFIICSLGISVRANSRVTIEFRNLHINIYEYTFAGNM